MIKVYIIINVKNIKIDYNLMDNIIESPVQVESV